MLEASDVPRSTVHLTIDFVEVAAISPDDPFRGDALGTLYASPYGRMSYDDFAARLASELVHELGAEPVHTADAYGLYVRLTPSIPAGAGLLRLSVRGRRLDVAAALDPEEWRRADVATKRVLLLERALACLAAAEDWPFGPSLDRARERICGAYPRLAVERAALAAQGTLVLRRELYAALEVEAWKSASESARRSTLDAIRRAHPELGPASLRERGELPSASFAAAEEPFRWQLVPGTRRRPGFSRQTWAKARAWCDELIDGNDATALLLHGSDAACDVRATDEIDVGPLLIADVCLPGPAHDPVYDWMHAWASLDWRTAVARCLADRWSLPTTFEMEWAAAGATLSLFPWGDDPGPILRTVTGIGDALAQSYGLGEFVPEEHEATDPMRVFGSTNRLGLVAPLSETTWCLPEATDLVTPHRAVGGAMGSFPWQGGSESAAFFTAAHHRWGIDLGSLTACVRPVLRFVAPA